MSERKRVFVLILIMALSSLIVATITILSLYRAAIDEEKERLIESAQSQARLIEAVARFDAIHSRSYVSGGARAATLSQIVEAHRSYEQSGRTAEFTLAKRKGDSIIFLLSHRYGGLGDPRPISFNSKLAEPMRAALSGRSGTILGDDYRGEVVLAAHEPVSELDLGIVAKIDLSEIRAPFMKAGIIALFFSGLVVLGGATLFLRISNPMIRLLEEGNVRLAKTNKNLQQEIDERKRAEGALLESEKKYRQLVENLQEGVWSINKDAYTTYVNPRMAEMIGYTVDEMQGKHLFSFMDERGVEIAQRNLERRKQGIQEQHDSELFHKNGTRVYTSMEASPVTDEAGNYVGALACVADITDRKRAEDELSRLNLEFEERVQQRTAQLQIEIVEREQAEEKLQKNKDMLQMIFDGISEPLIMLGNKLEVGLLNKAAAEYYHVDPNHVDPKNVVGKPCYKAFNGRSTPCEDCRLPSALLNGKQVTYERDGHMDPHLVEQVSVYPIHEKRSKTGGVILRISDITEKRKIEKQLIRADRLSSLGQLSGGIAHEIRNPLSGINLFVDILADEEKFSRADQELEIFQEIKHNINKINGIITRILDFARDSRATSGEIDVNALIEEITRLWYTKIRDAKIKLQLSLQKDLLTVCGDAIGIQQVMNNLIQNAIEAMPAGGLLDIATRNAVSSFYQDRPVVLIRVGDSGSGIPPKQREKVFDPFFTTKSTGTGLGLSISHQIVERHGGIISFESLSKQATTFSVELPAAPGS